MHQVCQYMESPTSVHHTTAKRILRYLTGTLHLGPSFRLGPLTLSAFTDVDWASDLDDRRSTSSLFVYLGPNPITWSAKKQLIVSRSSTKSEYRALALASAVVCWLQTLLKDLGVFIPEAPILWCDNIFALAITSKPVFHARTKHIEIDFQFVQECVLRKDLVVKLFLYLINLLISSPKAFLYIAFLIFAAISWLLFIPLRLRRDAEDKRLSYSRIQPCIQSSPYDL